MKANRTVCLVLSYVLSMNPASVRESISIPVWRWIYLPSENETNPHPKVWVTEKDPSLEGF